MVYFLQIQADFESVSKNGLKPAPFVPLLSTACDTGSFFNNLRRISYVYQGFSERLRWTKMLLTLILKVIFISCCHCNGLPQIYWFKTT